MSAVGSGQLSKDFFELIKSIGESRTKQEEDKVVLAEVRTLKANMAAKDVPSKRMREYLIRMIYVEMLGHEASFGQIHAIKMLSSRNLLEKRVGYLAAALVLHKDHAFILLLVNALQKDLESDNFLEAAMALTTVARLINTSLIPAVLPFVSKLLEHQVPMVRKKAVACLHRFFELDPTSLTDMGEKIKRALCDPDPSVMGATLLLLQELVSINPHQYKELVPSFVSILKQIIDHRLPNDFDYHFIPAPWIQMDLMRLLAKLGHADRHWSSQMYDVLGDALKRATVGTNIGYAIVAECVRTIATIYPNQELLTAAGQAVALFLKPEQHGVSATGPAQQNFRYVGLTLLSALVRVDPSFVAEHQVTVIDCLEDSDETLKRKTLDFLVTVTNPANVTAIVDKLVRFLRLATDSAAKVFLITRIAYLAERYAPDTDWFIATMNNAFELAGDATPARLGHSVLHVIAQGTGDVEGDMGTRQRAVDSYIALLQTARSVPDTLLKVAVWTIGEYGHLSSILTPPESIDLLCETLNSRSFLDSSVRLWLFGAVQSLLARLTAEEPIPPAVLPLVRVCQASRDPVLAQRAIECAALLVNRPLLQAVQPVDSHAPLAVDPALSFLDAFVRAAAAAGAAGSSASPAAAAAAAAVAAAALTGIVPAVKGKTLRFEAYAKPPETRPEPPRIVTAASAPVAAAATAAAAGGAAGGAGADTGAAADMDSGIKLKSSARRAWGPKGFNADKQAEEAKKAEAAAAAAAAASAASASAAAATAAAAAAEADSRKTSNAAAASAAALASAAATAAAAAAAAAKPRAPTQKELAAKSLFAGLTTSSAPAAGMRPPAARPAAAAAAAPAGGWRGAAAPAAAAPAAAAAAPTAAAAAGPMPLDLLFASDNSSAAAPAATASSNAGSFDLLSVMGSSAPATITPSAGAGAGASAAPFSLGTGFTPAFSAAAPAASAGAALSASPLDLLSPTSDAEHAASPFDFFGTGSSSSSSVMPATTGHSLFSPTAAVPPAVGAAAALASIPALAQQLSALQEVVSETSAPRLFCGSFNVTYTVHAGPAAAVLTVYLANPSQAQSWAPVALAVTLPSAAATASAVSVAALSPYEAPAVGRGNGAGYFLAQLGSVPAATTVALTVTFTSAAAALFAGAAGAAAAVVKLSAQFGGHDGGKKGSFDSLAVSVPAPALLRPLQLVTKQYAEAWKTLGATGEAKLPARPVPAAAGTTEGIAALARTAGLHVVQTIATAAAGKQETIAAGHLLGSTAAATPVLVHLRLAEGALAVHVRAEAAPLAAAVADAVAAAAAAL